MLNIRQTKQRVERVNIRTCGLLNLFSSVESESEDPLAQLAKELTKFLEHRRRALYRDKTWDQYLVFTSKVLSNPAHELSIGPFRFLIFLELHAMNIHYEILPLGSTTVTLGNWTKKANWALALTNSRLNCVVEVGLPESARQLAIDAHGHPPLFQRGVLHSLKDTTSVTGESYMNGTTTIATRLDLPFDKGFNRSPHPPVEGDLVIPEQELRHLAENIWPIHGNERTRASRSLKR
ncbi:hypothetical protein BJX63DRAFT_445123 [Aspergillus granulosus]|uniref:Uncharacterized protein n=1 Tax=Aspergillus granulosus TaxID=176169 RepID=A0ABR4H4J2_9EURO